jgi:hypothetical protein
MTSADMFPPPQGGEYFPIYRPLFGEEKNMKRDKNKNEWERKWIEWVRKWIKRERKEKK